MRRMKPLLVAVAAMTVLSAVADARAFQGSASPLRSAITGKNLGKALANPGVDVFFWSQGVPTLLGTVGPNQQVFYTPGSAPSAVIQNTKGCGATYLSLQKWCPFPVTAYAVKCTPAVDSNPTGSADGLPPLADGDDRAAVSATGGDRTVMMMVADSERRDFEQSILKGSSGSFQCKAPTSDRLAALHFGDSFVLDGSSGAITITVDVAITATPSDSGSSVLTNPVVVGVTAVAVGGGIYFAERGSSSSPTTPGTMTPTPSGETRSEGTVVNNTFTATYTISASSSCGFPTSATGTITFSGNQTATTAVVTGLPIGTINLTGSVSQSSTNGAFSANLSGSNGTPTGGTAALTINITFTINANTGSGTGTGASGCGSWTITISLNR